jgi:hypothetical protein
LASAGLSPAGQCVLDWTRRFAIAASITLAIRLAEDLEHPSTDEPKAHYPAFERVDLHHFTFRAPRDGSYIVALENPASKPVDVAPGTQQRTRAPSHEGESRMMTYRPTGIRTASHQPSGTAV